MTTKIVSINKRSSIYFNLFFSPLIFFICAFYFSIGFAKAPPESFADLSDQVSSSVVNIASTVTSENAPLNEFPQFPPGSPFEEFFKDFMDKGPARRPSQSLGSGFIISKEGLIVTNNHVIANASSITVVLHDGTSLQAKLIGADTKTDLAVLKVKTDLDLKAVSWGNSDKIKVGNWAMAIGNPFGLVNTVTVGIVSARARDINAGPFDDFIQTDASINRGNSGGPLFNLDGQVIGVNTAIYSPSGGSVGIGFAIPSALAKNVVGQLNKHGRTIRGWLGVRIQTVTEDLAESLGLDRAYGALVATTLPGSPAEKSGIKPGDIILEFDGKRVDKMRTLPKLVAETKVGKKVTIKIWRFQKLISKKVLLGRLESSGEFKAEKENKSDDIKTTKIENLKILVRNLNKDDISKRELPKNTTGVVVTEILQGSPLIFVSVNDVIVELQKKKVVNSNQFSKLVNETISKGAKTLYLAIYNSRNQRSYITVKLK